MQAYVSNVISNHFNEKPNKFIDSWICKGWKLDISSHCHSQHFSAPASNSWLTLLLLSAACSLGLLLAVSLTVANGGSHLIADCHSGLLDPLVPLDQGSGHADCPFDPTKIYVSPIIFSAFLQSTEPGSCPLITRTCHSCLTSSPCLPPFHHLLGHSLGSLDPFCVHVCSRGCSLWLLLCGYTHPAWGRAL